jgi:hypothetical protein
MPILYDASVETLPDHLQPRLLSALDGSDVSLRAAELTALHTLHSEGYALAPIVVIPAAVEERFYRLNNLPEQLQTLFEPVNQQDPDEDDIEELAPEAVRLFKTHYLLDEFIDTFYQAIEVLPDKLQIRRAGMAGETVVKGRPALLAVKDLWASEWTFEALMDRLEQTQTIALEARPVVIGPAGEAPVSEAETRAFQQLLGVTVKGWQVDGEISRLSFS